jgi:arylsulfatase A-like enzyme
LFSGVDLVPTLLGLLVVEVPADVEGMSHADNLLGGPAGQAPIREHVYTEKNYHDSFDPIRAIRTKEYSYIENYAQRPLLDLPWDIAESPSGQAVAEQVRGPRPERELYDLVNDPGESHNLLAYDAGGHAEKVAQEFALTLHDWRRKTKDVIPSDFVGTRISEHYTEDYLAIHGPKLASRSAIADERGVGKTVQSPQ